MTLFPFLKELVDLNSTTGREESAAEFIARDLEQKGFTVLRQRVSADRFNVFASLDEPVVVFSSHVDTIPPHFPFSEDEGNVYGRGACDAKGAVAAQIKAGERLMAEGFRQFGFLYLVGEESGSDGARRANTLANKCRFVICGEPTDNKLALGSKGALRISLESHGRSAHSAHPEQGDSAILKLLDVLAELRLMELPVHSILGSTTMNIGTLSGGNQANVIADKARAELFFRLSCDAESIKRKISALVGKNAVQHVHFECDPMFFDSIEGFDTTVVSFTTDLPLLSNWGKPLLIGPGSILDAHTANERISKRELERGLDQYYRLAKMCINGEVSVT